MPCSVCSALHGVNPNQKNFFLEILSIKKDKRIGQKRNNDETDVL